MSKIQLIPLSFFEKAAYVSVLIFLASLTFSTALMEITSVTMLVGWAILKIKKGWGARMDKKIFYFLLAFIVLSVISSFWSEFPKQSFRGILKVLRHFFLFWIVAETLTTPERHRTALKVLAASFLFLGLDGVWQYAFGKDLLRGIAYEPASSGPRISASFKNYGLLAAYLISFLPLLTAYFERGGGRKRNLAVAVVAFSALLLLFWTRLRGAWVAFVGGVLFYLWQVRKRFYVFLVMALIAVGVFFLPRSMVIHLDSEGKEQSLVERLYLWDRAFQVILAKPWTGTGINTYAVAHQKYDRRKSWRVQNYYAHNGYLQIAAETGLPTLFCFLAFLFFYFRKVFQVLKKVPEGLERRTLAAILTGMVNFLILAMIDTIFHNPASVHAFWFLAGWGLAYQNLLKNS